MLYSEHISGQSLRGRMLRNWGQEELDCTQGKDHGKMIWCCMFEWMKEPIEPDLLYCLRYGSLDEWVCQALSFYVKTKEPQKIEESRDYAACWRKYSSIFVTKSLMELKGERRREKWDPLDHLPPPYVPDRGT